MGTVIKGFPQQWERALIGGVEGQSDFAHLPLVAVVTFTPIGGRRRVCGVHIACAGLPACVCFDLMGKIQGQLDTREDNL